MKIKLLIILVSSLLLCGCTDPDAPSKDYEDGYSRGYSEGKMDGYNEGYSACKENTLYEQDSAFEYTMYETLQDYGIITFKMILADIPIEEREQIIDIVSNYYTDKGIYGEFVGDSSTRLLHDVEGDCFTNIDSENLVLFDSSLDYVLDCGNYLKCDCLNDDSPLN